MRLFVGIEVPETFKNELEGQQASIKNQYPTVEWIDSSKWYVVLRFLGNPQRKDRKNVISAVEKACQSVLPWKLSLGKIECFPVGETVTRTIVASVKEQSFMLERFLKELDGNLSHCRVPAPSEDFTPHIVLARVQSDTSKGRLRRSAQMLSLKALEAPVEHCVVVQSELSHEGPIYNIITKQKFSAELAR